MLNIFRVLSLLLLIFLFWCIMILPSQHLKLKNYENYNLSLFWADSLENVPKNFPKMEGELQSGLFKCLQNLVFAKKGTPRIIVALIGPDKKSTTLLIRRFDENGEHFVDEFKEDPATPSLEKFEAVASIKDKLIVLHKLYKTDIAKKDEILNLKNIIKDATKETKLVLPKIDFKNENYENYHLHFFWAESLEKVPKSFPEMKGELQSGLINLDQNQVLKKETPGVIVATIVSDRYLLIRRFDKTGKKVVDEFKEDPAITSLEKYKAIASLKGKLEKSYFVEKNKSTPDCGTSSSPCKEEEKKNFLQDAAKVTNSDFLKIDFKGDDKKEKAAIDLAKLELEKKVYPEIQERLTKINDWIVTKIQFAGALLGAFVIQLWLPYLTKNDNNTNNNSEKSFPELISSPQACAVSGIACIVSLFMDLHIRENYKMIQQLGSWAGEYAEQVLGGSIQNFPGWEQFLRMPGPENGGLHESLTNALQTGSLGIMTLVIFTFYHWSFQTVCLRFRLILEKVRSDMRDEGINDLSVTNDKEYIKIKLKTPKEREAVELILARSRSLRDLKVTQPDAQDEFWLEITGLDVFNRLIYWVFIGTLGIFVLSAHTTSGNFEFVDYGVPCLFSNAWPFIVVWLLFSLITITWDFIGYIKNK